MNIQFELEQAILNCWNVVEDIKDYRTALDNGELTEDEKDNYLIGLEAIYSVKFTKTFDLFEKLVQEIYQAKQANKPAI